MGLTVDVETIRTALKNARDDFRPKDTNRYLDTATFYKLLGKENNMRVIINEYKEGFPVIDKIEFDDEKSLAWFIMRWS